MEYLEELIEKLTNNIEAIDTIFFRLNSKHAILKKYILKINKEYLNRADEWFFNKNYDNKYFKITKKKLSEILFSNKISEHKIQKLIPMLVELNLIILVGKDTYDIPKYNIDEIINKAFKNENFIVEAINTKMTERELKLDHDRTISYLLIEEFILSNIKESKFVPIQKVESHFIQIKAFSDVQRRVRIGIEKTINNYDLMLIQTDKKIKLALNLSVGYPKIIITKEFYKKILRGEFNGK